MGKKIRSARGDLVDFDLLKIKEQMATSVPPQVVRARQDFIERRLRRRLKKVTAPAPAINTQDRSSKIEPRMAATEELVGGSSSPKPDDSNTKSRQRVRPPKKESSE